MSFALILPVLPLWQWCVGGLGFGLIYGGFYYFIFTDRVLLALVLIASGVFCIWHFGVPFIDRLTDPSAASRRSLLQYVEDLKARVAKEREPDHDGDEDRA